MRTTILIGALGCALSVCGPATPARAADTPAAHPRIDGAWTLNREMSSPMRGGADVPSGRDDDGAGPGGGGRRRGGFGMGGGFGGGMRPMVGGGGMPDRAEMRRRQELMQELLQPSPRMTITVDGDAVSFTESDGRVRKYVANGKKEKHQFVNGTVQTKTKWDKDGLVIESSLEGGMKVIQSYGLASDRRQLIVRTKMDGGMTRDGGKRKPIMRYYDDLSASQ
jgi:hypothetical protein